MEKLHVFSDIKKNRLYFTASGKITKKGLEKLYTDVRFCVADLQPGFDVISDLSECKLAALNGIPTFRKIMNYLITNGVGEVARVISKKQFLFRQMINLASRTQGFKPICVTTLEEAEEQLANAIKRNGLRFQLHQQAIEYMRGDEKGEATILNISTSGCAVESATLQPSVDEEILIQIDFAEEDCSSGLFKSKARVIREKKNTFAAEFMDLDNDQKNQLWECLVNASRCEINTP